MRKRHPNAKLTDQQAFEIIEARYLVTQKELAGKYNVSIGTIQGIHQHRYYRRLE